MTDPAPVRDVSAGEGAPAGDPVAAWVLGALIVLAVLVSVTLIVVVGS